LQIKSNYDSRTVDVRDEISIGRADAADIVLDDSGLSRVNTTFFIDEGELWVADENSTNGTFVNGERVSGKPRLLRDGDSLTIGSSTTIRVETDEGSRQSPQTSGPEPIAARPAVRQTPSVPSATPSNAPQPASGSE
ncbi:MAG TPA: hypothetical protein DDW24_11395, partial [Blastocatellia bacterium]|nr:hypothetical protein [Blastocatellia bacterium]